MIVIVLFGILLKFVTKCKILIKIMWVCDYLLNLFRFTLHTVQRIKKLQRKRKNFRIVWKWKIIHIVCKICLMFISNIAFVIWISV